MKKSKKLIEIYETPDGKIETRFYPDKGIDTIKCGAALASATRVISAAFIDAMDLDKTHLKPIQDQIQKFYNDDLEIGTMGEEDNTKSV